MSEKRSSIYNRPPIKEAVFDLQTRNEQILTNQLFNSFLSQLTSYSGLAPIFGYLS